MSEGRTKGKRTFAAAVCIAGGLGAGAAFAAVALQARDGVPSISAGTAAVRLLLAGRWYPGWAAIVESPAQAAGLRAAMELLDTLSWVALAMACGTIAALALSRGVGRRREVAVRAALGGTPAHIAGAMAREVVRLALACVAAGVAAGLVALALLLATRPGAVRPYIAAAASLAPMLLSLSTPALVLLCLAPVPAIGAATWRLAATLGAGARATAPPAEGSFRNAVAVTQLAVALSLLTGAGLLLRGERAVAGARLAASSPSTQTLTFDLLPGGTPGNVRARAGYYRDILERVSQMPGVRAETLASAGAWLGDGPVDLVEFRCPDCFIDGVGTPIKAIYAQHHLVGPGFFATLGFRVVGREFSATDSAGAAPVAVINRSFAEQFLHPKTDPWGLPLKLHANATWYTIVGVVPDVPAAGPGAGQAPGPAVYLPLLQHPPLTAGLAVRVGPGTRERTLERAIAAAGGAVVERPSIEQTRSWLARPVGWAGGAALALAALATLLAGHGAAAVAADEVRRRRRELGIRAALGASPRHLVLQVLLKAVRRVVVGAAWASGGTILVAWLLQRTSPQLPLFDPAVYALALACIAVTSLLAAIGAAGEAARSDPREVLAEE